MSTPSTLESATLEALPPQPSVKATDSKLRMPQLDALRGLAALSVFCFHALSMLPEKPRALVIFSSTPLGAIFNGRSAVWLFFVLSGFVLNLKYAEIGNYPKYWKTDFIVRRIFRLYPAFLVSLILALVVKALIFDPAQAYAIYPKGFAGEWQEPIPTSDVAKLATLVWPGVKLHLNTPVWSLVEEMRVSLIFPFLVILVNRGYRKFPNLLLLALVYAAGVLFPHFSTLRYLGHFVLGAICARHIRSILSWLEESSRTQRDLWLVGSFTFYGMSAVTSGMALTLPVRVLVEQAVGLGAAGMILFCAALVSPKGFMATRLKFLGDTSYSFYLLHSIFLFGFSFWIIKFTGSYLVAWGAVLVLTYLVAYLVFECVEQPMNRIGHHALRWVLGRINPSVS